MNEIVVLYGIRHVNLICDSNIIVIIIIIMSFFIAMNLNSSLA